MKNYIALPEYQVPRNAMIDFSGVNNAFENVRQQRNHNALVARQDEERSYQRGRNAVSDARAARSETRQQVEWFGKQALAVDQINGPERSAVWGSIIARHPNAGSLAKEYLDPVTGPKLVAAEAGQWSEPDPGKTYEVGDRLVNVGPGGVKELYSAPEKPDPVRELLLQRLQPKPAAPQGAPTTAPVPTQPNMLRPQSNVVEPQMPGVVLANEPEAVGPSPEALPRSPQPNMIDTPYGAMTREEAQQLGGTMLLDPKYAAAGRALLDSVQSGNAADLAKTTVNQIEERTLNSAAQLGRIGDIKKTFQGRFLQVPERMKMLTNAWTSKLTGQLPPQARQDLADYAKFRSAAVNNLNAVLKEMSGAAVTPQEYERIQNDAPTAGTGIFDGDDPVSFQAKLERTEQSLKMAIARMNFMKAQGLNFTKDKLSEFMALEDVPGAIDRRGAEIEAELRQANPQADPMSIEREALKRVKREFGI